MQPYTIDVSNDVIADLKSRLTQTRWPDEIGQDWQYGTDLNYIKSLCDYWLHEYDWPTQQSRLNDFDHFKTEIEADRQLHRRFLFSRVRGRPNR